MKKHNWKELNFTSENDDSKNVEENNLTIAPIVLHAKNKKYTLFMFQNIP